MSRSATNWDFVVNNYTEQILSQLQSVFSKKSFFKKAIGYYEVGAENGTPHIQGYFSYCKKTTKSCILKESGINDDILENRVSIRPVNNLSATINYIKKDGNLWFSNIDINDDSDWRKLIGTCRKHIDTVSYFNCVCSLIKRYKELNIEVPKNLITEIYDNKYDYIKYNCDLCKYIIDNDWETL